MVEEVAIIKHEQIVLRVAFKTNALKAFATFTFSRQSPQPGRDVPLQARRLLILYLLCHVELQPHMFVQKTTGGRRQRLVRL